MLKAYVNYPNPEVMVHRKPTCRQIMKMHKRHQRSIHIDVDTLSSELKKFCKGGYRFGSSTEVNDMWIEADFADTDFEEAVIRHILQLLSKRYGTFRGISLRFDRCTHA